MGTVDKIAELKARRAEIEQCGGKAKIDKQHDAKKLTARERILYLLDEGSFIEVDAFVKQRCEQAGETGTPAEGVITGYGTVDSRLVYVYAQDYTVINGALGEMHAKKICKIMDMAVKMGAPVVGMCDSGGARIGEGVEALAGMGEILSKNIMASGVIPQITAVMGPCAGGAAFTPALGDFVFMVDGTSKMYVSGPSILSVLSGKKVSDEDMADAAAHTGKIGTAHFKAQDDRSCIDGIKLLLSYLPSNNLEESPYVNVNDDINRISENLTSIIPDDSKQGYDVKNVINQIADAGSFLEVQPDYAKNIVVGFARMNGSTVGIVANQSEVKDGELDNAASIKASRFVRFCDCFNIAILTFTDVACYSSELSEEIGGIVKNAPKLMYAYAEATVPKINVILRKAYGSAYLAMCSKQLGADIVYAWPTAEIAVMSPDGAANLVLADAKTKAKDPMLARQEKINEYKEKYANPYEAAKYGFIDDIIEPDSTRPVVIAALEMLASKRETRPTKKHGNIPM